MMLHKFPAVLTIFLSYCAQFSTSNLVNDNSFESYQAIDYSYSATSSYWGTYLGIQSGSAIWGGTTAADGNMYLALQPGNARVASQSISLSNLNSYKLSLYASSRTNGQACTAPLSVLIGSTLVLYVTQPPLSTTMQYYSTTFTYRGQSGTTTLTLENSEAGNADCTIFIDDIVLILTGKRMLLICLMHLLMSSHLSLL